MRCWSEPPEDPDAEQPRKGRELRRPLQLSQMFRYAGA